MRVNGKEIAPPPSLGAKQPEPAAPGSAPVTDLRDPTPDEARNGWTREKLVQYLEQRAEQQQTFARERAISGRRPVHGNSANKFDPHRW